MRTFEERLIAAEEELEAAGVAPSTSKPPIIRLLRHMGVQARPPHYASFATIFVAFGLAFAVGWGVLMWFLYWSSRGFPVWLMVGGSALAGVLFGLIMALYYRQSRNKLELTPWEDL